MFFRFLVFLVRFYASKKRQVLRYYGIAYRKLYDNDLMSLDSYKTREGNSFKMMLRHPGRIEDIIHGTRSWEADISDKLSYFMADEKYFIDIGANIGYCSMYVAADYPKSKVIAFEPHPFISKELKRNAELNSLFNIDVQLFALGNENGEIRFHSNDLNDYNRGLSSTVDEGFSENIVDITVEIKRLDDVIPMEEYHKVGVIKVDTQGNELDVLRGAEKIIQAAKPVIVFEFEHKTMRNIEETKAGLNTLLLSNSYKTYKIIKDFKGVTPYDIASTGSEFNADLVCIPDLI